MSNYFRSIGILCSLYIDDRHDGQLQVPRNIKGGYFLGLSKFILNKKSCSKPWVLPVKLFTFSLLRRRNF